jgi:hypothetical protein
VVRCPDGPLLTTETLKWSRLQGVNQRPRLDANTHKPSNPNAPPTTTSSLYMLQIPTSMHLARTPSPTVRASPESIFLL